MSQANDVLQRFLERLAREQGCDLHAAAKLLLEHEWREVQYRHQLYPQIAAAIHSEPIDFATLRDLLVKSKDSPTGGHVSTRGHVDAFLKLKNAESLIRALFGDTLKPPGPTAIGQFIRDASDLAFFTDGKTRKNRQHAESALFTSVLLTAVFPDTFVDYRNDRWSWAIETLQLSGFPRAEKMVYDQYIAHAGKAAAEIANTKAFQEYFNVEPKLWTVAGLVFLLCKGKHYKYLIQMPDDAPLLPSISPVIRAAFERFRNDPQHSFVVALRHHRAEKLRELLSDPEEMDLDTFNHEAWVLCKSARIGETDVTKRILSDQDFAPDELKRFSDALANGTLEFKGNSIWGAGASVFGSNDPSDAESKLQTVRKALAILNEKKPDPFIKASRIQELRGFGRNVTTGLCMVRHPEEIALFNKRSTDGLGKVGLPAKDFDSFQDSARHLQHAVHADDFIQLDLFLYLVSEGRIVLDSPTPPQPVPQSLNMILYGPPGTGKTYHTINHAVSICDGSIPEARSDLVARFKTLQDEGQIAFVTFHQSYGYEDFVEGIRPVLVDDAKDSREVLADDAMTGAPVTDESIRYECSDGAFKKICALAKSRPSKTSGPSDIDLGTVEVWKMSLGNVQKETGDQVFDECIEENAIRLGYGGHLDFKGCDDKMAVLEKFKTANADASSKDYNVQAVNSFKNRVKVGDLVVVSDGNHKFRAIGRVVGEYEYREREEGYAQARPVEWLRVYDESLPYERIMRKSFSQMTHYRLKPKVLKKESLEDLLRERGDATPKNYVLVVDEINRGNISKILGELITLLEPDKRLGAENELQVELPYSKTLFGVPPNLFVIGTMNTADRSIAFMDTALRRRFDFVEMMPDSQVVRDHVGDGGTMGNVDVAGLLDVINERIELLFDRDHQIGHSYLMQATSLEELRGCFVDRVIPLLQEYFFNDWRKLCIVLGCPYDPYSAKPLVKANESPIISARLLRASSLPGSSVDEIDDELRFEVNSSFNEAKGSGLEAYFLGIFVHSGSGDQA